ncbi:MAG: ATP-binding protein [Spirochaetaceae bacterium]|jgi:two-component system phosphate regulon sensor histidine kinase PhoR|nr:ATP-binding protein [Spirochaetaceae bacterium]
MKTVFGKSLLILGAAALGIFIFFAIALLVFMNSLYYETNRRNISETARLLLPFISAAFFSEEAADPEAPPLLPDDSIWRLTLIDASGAVLSDSRFDAASMENHASRPEVAAALAGTEGAALRQSDTAGVYNLYHALPVYKKDDDPKSGKPIGVMRLAMPVPGFRNRVAAAMLPNLYLPLLIIAAAIGAVYLFSRSLAKSFVRLEKLTRAVSSAPHTAIAGLSPVISVEDTEEFRTLESALREMAAELAGRISVARAEGARLEGILNGMKEAVFAMDDRLMLNLINPAARRLFSIPDEKETGTLCLLEAVHATELEYAARRVLENGKAEESEFRLSIDGTRRFFRVFTGPLSYGGVIIVLEDVSRVKRLEQIRKDFVANVSHELRTPIQLIKGYAETLLFMPPEDGDTLRRIITIIAKNAAVMENLTGDLLTLAALEHSGGGRLETEERSIRPLLEEALETAAFLAPEKKALVSIDCPAELSAKVHGALLTQAVINLLDNAVKYAASASKITVRAFTKGELVIEVEDNGAGIPPEHLDRLFERFYQAERSRARPRSPAGTGAGLGLAIVRHIALIHGGAAEAESSAGVGSVFRIRIPVL